MADLYWDPFDIELDLDPYDTWKRMRDDAPLYRNDQYDFWALSRFADVEAAHRDPKGFSSAHGTVLEIMTDDPYPGGQMIFLDAPEHTRSADARLAARSRPRRIEALEGRIRELSADFLDRLSGRDSFDYVQDFAVYLPSMVISSLLGVPLSDQEMLRKLIDQVFHIEPGVGMVNDVSLTAQIDINTYIRGQLEECLRNPRDDMMTDLTVAEITDDDGETRRLTIAEAADFSNLLISAGTETVARLLGWAAVVLEEHPDQRAELAADPTLVPKAVEELLRYEAPSPVQGRWLTREVELHGETAPRRREGAPPHRLRGSRRARVPERRSVRHPPRHRSPRVVRVRHPLLHRRRTRPHGRPHRAAGDARAVPGVDRRPRTCGAPPHQHRAGMAAGTDPGVTHRPGVQDQSPCSATSQPTHTTMSAGESNPGGSGNERRDTASRRRAHRGLAASQRHTTGGSLQRGLADRASTAVEAPALRHRRRLPTVAAAPAPEPVTVQQPRPGRRRRRRARTRTRHGAAAAAPNDRPGIFVPKWVGMLAAAIVAALVFGGIGYAIGQSNDSSNSQAASSNRRPSRERERTVVPELRRRQQQREQRQLERQRLERRVERQQLERQQPNAVEPLRWERQLQRREQRE